MASSFRQLRDFIQKQMRMSHIYQPVMIKELLRRGGKTSIRNIAATFLAHDASQLEYYEQITKNMPGKVLAKHGIVHRDGDNYKLTLDPSKLSRQERDDLILLCNTAINDYLAKTRCGGLRSSQGSARPPLGRSPLRGPQACRISLRTLWYFGG